MGMGFSSYSKSYRRNCHIDPEISILGKDLSDTSVEYETV